MSGAGVVTDNRTERERALDEAVRRAGYEKRIVGVELIDFGPAKIKINRRLIPSPEHNAGDDT